MNKTERKANEIAYRQSALRQEQAKAAPSPDRVKNATAWALESLMQTIRQERQRQKLSLDAVAERSGVEKAMLSKLENGKLINAQLDTLMRIARALNKVVSLQLTVPRKPVVRSSLDRGAIAAYLASRKNNPDNRTGSVSPSQRVAKKPIKSVAD